MALLNKNILFLALDAPWPPHSGANLRSWGLLRELSRYNPIEMIVLTREALSIEQESELRKYVHSIYRIPLKDASLFEKLAAAANSALMQIPYHCAVLENSLRGFPEIRQKIQQYSGPVFTSIGHWGCLVRRRSAQNWILNQCDADVEFWRVYASQTNNFFMRLVAWITYIYSKKIFPAIYANVGLVISVCEEDRQLTLALCPSARVDVIENGVDCAYHVPERVERLAPPRLLFTGTSVARNVLALRRFAVNILPLISKKILDVELLGAGRFSERAQAMFRSFHNIKFTGAVPDMRPFFNQSDVFIAPFEETHGSKLKIAEAMAMAMPIVSTPQGIRGFPLVDGESVLIARDVEHFASLVVELLGNPLARHRLGLAAREIAERNLDWPKLGQRLEKIVADVREGFAPT